MDTAVSMLSQRRTRQEAQRNSTVVARLDRAIQYAAASAFNMTVSGILGRPVKPGDDSGVGSIIRVGPKADTEAA